MPPPPPKPMPYKAKSTAPPPPPVRPMPQLEDPNSRQQQQQGQGASRNSGGAPPRPQPYQQQQHRPPPPVYHVEEDSEERDGTSNTYNNINSLADLPANYRKPSASQNTPKTTTMGIGGASAGGASPGDSGTNYPTVSTSTPPSTTNGRRGSSSGGTGRRGSAQVVDDDLNNSRQQHGQKRRGSSPKNHHHSQLSIPQGMDAEAIAQMTLQGSGKGEIPYGERADVTVSEVEKMRTQIAELTRENQMNSRRLAEFFSPQSVAGSSGQQQTSPNGITVCNENTPVSLLLARVHRLETALQLESITREELETKNQAHVVEVAILSRKLEIAKQKLQKARRGSS